MAHLLTDELLVLILSFAAGNVPEAEIETELNFASRSLASNKIKAFQAAIKWFCGLRSVCRQWRDVLDDDGSSLRDRLRGMSSREMPSREAIVELLAYML